MLATFSRFCNRQGSGGEPDGSTNKQVIYLSISYWAWRPAIGIWKPGTWSFVSYLFENPKVELRHCLPKCCTSKSVELWGWRNISQNGAGDGKTVWGQVLWHGLQKAIVETL